MRKRIGLRYQQLKIFSQLHLTCFILLSIIKDMKINAMYYQNDITPLKTVEKFFGEAHTTFLLSDDNQDKVVIQEGAKVLVREEYYMGFATRFFIYSNGFVINDDEQNFWSGFILEGFDTQALQLLSENCNQL